VKSNPSAGKNYRVAPAEYYLWFLQDRNKTVNTAEIPKARVAKFFDTLSSLFIGGKFTDFSF
jgi:hypothetical protein